LGGQNHKRNKTEVIDENLDGGREFIVKTKTQPFRILPQIMQKDKVAMRKSLEIPVVGLINKEKFNKRVPLIQVDIASQVNLSKAFLNQSSSRIHNSFMAIPPRSS
jgi:hypothetical protein